MDYKKDDIILTSVVVMTSDVVLEPSDGEVHVERSTVAPSSEDRFATNISSARCRMSGCDTNHSQISNLLEKVSNGSGLVLFSSESCSSGTSSSFSSSFSTNLSSSKIYNFD
jgi:hypothetical protein